MSAEYGQFICIDDVQVKKYLKSFTKEDFALGKEYELIAALILKNWFQITYKIKCKIGLKIQQKYLQACNKNPVSLEETKKLFELYRNEDDPIDFVICPLSVIRLSHSTRLSSKAWAFQVKRFGKFQETKDTEGLRNFLTHISKKYSQSKLTLVIFFDGHKGINPQAVNDHIKTLTFPFREVMFINTSKNEKAEWKMHIGEFWLNWGYNEYEPSELFKYD